MLLADFFSPNCLREIDSAMKAKKPLILVHESDESKGGAPLEDLRADCESKGRCVFDDDREIIRWHRIAAFQLLSLKLIARAMLHAMPTYEELEEPPKVYIAGELGLQTFEFRHRVSLYVSDFNPGAAEMMTEVVVRYKDRNLNVRYDPPPQLHQSSDGRNSGRRPSAVLSRGMTASRLLTRHCSSFEQASRKRWTLQSRIWQQSDRQPHTLSSAADQVSHMLLYLNNTTFIGEDGQRLAHEVRRARAFGIEILLVHENDLKRGGCAFNRLFQTTPHDLVEEGIYGKIAIACHPEPHRIGKAAATLQPKTVPRPSFDPMFDPLFAFHRGSEHGPGGKSAGSGTKEGDAD